MNTFIFRCVKNKTTRPYTYNKLACGNCMNYEKTTGENNVTFPVK